MVEADAPICWLSILGLRAAAITAEIPARSFGVVLFVSATA
jgi:hypothetical protein